MAIGRGSSPRYCGVELPQNVNTYPNRSGIALELAAGKPDSKRGPLQRPLVRRLCHPADSDAVAFRIFSGRCRVAHSATANPTAQVDE